MNYQFLVSVVETMLSVFLLGFDVTYYGHFYVLKCFLFFGYRLFAYRKTKLHYFMWEFCYWASMSTGVFFLLLENEKINDPLWFRSIFSIAHGPLLLAAITIGDKMVFHDIQYMISLFMHLGPAMFTWGLRWKPESFARHNADRIDRSTDLRFDLHFQQGITAYLMWFIPYVTIVFILLENRIVTRGYDTMYSYFFRKSKVVMQDGFLRKLLYLMFHLVCAVGTATLSAIWYSSFVLDTLLIATVSVVVCWQAAKYYGAPAPLRRSSLRQNDGAPAPLRRSSLRQNDVDISPSVVQNR